MRAPSTVEVPCPACGEPIELSLGFESVEPVEGLNVASFIVTTPDLQDRAQSHGEVCPVLTGGGRDE
ncbi:hypothetical protein SEA_ELLIE_3 [Mycobacterium phage Ellie]|uniref:Uncharacterized protein n=1 Tax=Mycobacterium phage Ellie TaxID=2762405 RepID=A0A7G8LLV6_9CAUD|nr:hypothetical protein I5G88_gp03 [Mycobacterium phage Ellie]QNJ58228.1 hypothetical protein SEA_ELLIE_3 [Mycobacterium phage Ellie]QTF82005.1 hypothetical protein SEA_FEFFERHEAD_5 [Mycobacterium phage Fefferhead]